ncbi:hypothetical protein AB0469_35220 [Streptomyces sp. NPDC093801]|uniref:hypothetical protein n=1 Tax=Streptomyces sp. NPDC093801 TaxID=3155203 RepID=UPI00344CA122
MAALMAAVEPARPVTATGAGARPDGDDPAAKAHSDGVVDRSSPGVTSESFKAPEDLTGAGSDAAGARHKEGVFKTLIRAGATRWAKGGGTANKRLDLEKARASAHQVKETRTTTVMKSPGLPTRNSSGGAGGGGRNSTGSGSTGTGRGGSGGATGGGGSGASGNGGSGSPKDTSPKGAKDSGGKGKDGSSGNAGADGKAGKDGKAGASGSGGGSTSGGSSGGSSGGNSGSSKDTADKGKGAKVDLKKGGGSGQGSGGSSGSSGGSGKNGGSGSSGGSGARGSSGSGGGSGSSGGSGKNGAAGHSPKGTDNRNPLQRSREVGHGDGSAVRNAVDHVKAYAKGAKDGYQDKKEENGKEHARLDKAHADHKAQRQDPKKDDPKQGNPKGTTVTGPSGQTLVIAPPDEGDDGVSTDVKPLLVKEIDANTLTLGTDGARGSISRKELRNFKQYERKLEAKEDHLIKVADACKALQAAAEDEAKDCQDLAEQAKAVAGGEKLAAKLTKLADAAKAQAAEAAELHKRAKRAAEMCKVVLTNIGTRYAPLYKAVVDSDETKPAELRFYSDKGSYAPAA